MTTAHMWMNGWGVLLWLLSAAFWALLIVVIVAMLRGRPSSPVGRDAAALRILEDRYARGEMPREEFIERRSVLRGDAGAQPPQG